MSDTSQTLTITGLGDLNRALSRLDAATSGQAIRRALLVGALVVQNQAKQDAPVALINGGTLRRSIHIEPGDQTGVPEVFVGTDVVYAWTQEVRRGYLRPALNDHVDAVQREVTDALRDLIAAAVG